MNSSMFEYRGLNQFYKYRFVEELTVNFVSIKEYWYYHPNDVFIYEQTADFFYRAFNIRVNYEGQKISYHDTPHLAERKDKHKDKHVIMFPITSSFFDQNSDYYFPSSVIDVTDTVIVSAPIKTIVSSGLAFLAMDTSVIILIGMAVMVLSSLMTLNWTLIGGKKMWRRIGSKLLHNVWEHTSLLCAEPIPRISADITSRLSSMTWLVGVTIILFFVNCFMKTEFSVEIYQTIDSLSQLMTSCVKPQIIKGSMEEDNLNKMAINDQVIEEWYSAIAKDRNNFIKINKLFNINGYEDVISGKRVLIISKTDLMWIIFYVLEHNRETIKLIAKNGGICFSNAIHSNYRHYIYNKSFVTSSPEMKEIAQLSFYPFFESKPFAYLDFKLNYIFDYFTWKKPVESATDLGLSAMVVPFYFLFMLLLFSLSVVTLEILFPKQDGRYPNNKRRTVVVKQIDGYFD